MNNKRSYFIALLSLCLLLSFQNCNEPRFANEELDSASQADSPDTSQTLKAIQPALAVRAISCVLCHAQINANVITDFGYGTAEYMGGNKNFMNEPSWYNNVAGAWQSAHISGTVIVPKAKITPAAQDILGEAYQALPRLKLKDFLKIPYTISPANFLTPLEAQSEMLVNSNPAAGQETVTEKSEIIIRAPTESEIKSLAPKLWNVPEANAMRIGSNASLQFNRKGRLDESYLQNDENKVLECSNSDIVVHGTLLLRRLKVRAAGGCRLYVSGTVFIEEAITYVGEETLQNLQITSSSAIVMGLNTGTLTKRLITDNRGLILASRDYSNLAQQVVTESENIGTLRDAVEDYPARASFEYTGLLLNAPIIHSRYLGMVQGTVISDAILFTLGNFRFAFDPVFTQVAVLPLLTKPILSVR